MRPANTHQAVATAHQRRRYRGGRSAGVAAAAAIVLSAVAAGQDYQRVAPKQPETQQKGTVEPAAPRPVDVSDEPILDALRGMVFVPSSDMIEVDGREDVTGIAAEQLPLLGTDAFRRRVERFLGKPASLATLHDIAAEVVLHYRANDRPVVDVYVPEQDITSGVVQFMVQEARLGEVRVVGAQWFDPKPMKQQVRAEPGDPLVASVLQADSAWLSRNPFRRADVIFVPGTEPGTTDIELRVEDRMPLRVFGGYENSGIELLDEDRLFAGFNWGNAFGQAHELSYQYTTSADLDSFAAHSATYVAPLPWRHTLTVYGSYAETQADVAPPFDMDGHSWQISARYAVPLDSCSERFAHELRFGGDFKQTNNNLEFGGTRIYDTTADIVQAVIGYDARLDDEFGSTELGAALFLSPGGATDHNGRSDFSQARPGADPAYAYARFRLSRVTRLPKNFSLLLRGEAQLADGNLLATEQLGIGGYDTVRGYTEREANGDDGVWFSVELRTPPLDCARLFGIEDVDDKLQLLTFFDYGLVRPHDPIAGEAVQANLASAGVGLRYSITSVLSVRYDIGWQLTDSGMSPNGRNAQHHVGVVLSWSF